MGHDQSERVHIHEEDFYLTIRCLEKYGDISLVYAFDKTNTSGISSCLSVYINGSPSVVQFGDKRPHILRYLKLKSLERLAVARKLTFYKQYDVLWK